MRTDNKNMRLIMSFVLSVFIFSSCKSPNSCPETPIFGNLGKTLNSGYDDFMPKIFKDSLFFLSNRNEKKENNNLYYSAISKTKFLQSDIYKNKIYPKNELTSTPQPIDNYLGYLYSAGKPKEKQNKDLFLYDISSKELNKNIFVNINTKGFESQPAISPDGSFIVFAADYPDAIGETDLYISFRNPDGIFGKPENLGPNINTPKQEITPHISSDGNLYFSSNGYSSDGDFDIIKATISGVGKWTHSVSLKYPVNTDFDETAPFINDEKIYLSSNRPGGCGNFDIYAFNVCGPVILSVSIKDPILSIKPEGYFELIGQNNNLIEKKIVDSKTKISEFRLIPKEYYVINYKNDCYPNLSYSKEIFSPCSDTSVVKLIANVSLFNKRTDFDFSNFNVPFFVSGYYLPNTTENLKDLRLKFEYNLLNNSDSTKYIEYPDAKYDEYSEVVDNALDSTYEYIAKMIRMLDNHCDIKHKIEITITGFADPRPLSDIAKYNGIPIKEPDFNLFVYPGDRLNNPILSELRAYFIYKFLEKRINQLKDTYLISTAINWNISGKGTDDESSLPNDRKRRVKLEISIKE